MIIDSNKKLTFKEIFFGMMILEIIVLSFISGAFIFESLKSSPQKFEATHNAVFFSSNDDYLFSGLAMLYAEYFQAVVYNSWDILDIETNFSTIVVFAHGEIKNNTKNISLSLGGNFKDFIDFPSENVIFISCASWNIRSIDLDTNYYGYANETYEIDQYSVEYSENGIFITGWGSFFLDLIKQGYQWREAEFLAKNQADNLF